MFPNTFILLVSPPGVGKTDAIRTVRDVWSHFANLPVAPLSMTGKGIVDQLASEQSVQSVKIGGEQVIAALTSSDGDETKNLTGYSIGLPTDPCLFDVANVGEGMNSVTGDVRDIDVIPEESPQ